MNFKLPECISRKLPRNLKKSDENIIKVERKLTRRGNGWGVNIPPILIEKLNLDNGVILEECENGIMITAIGGKENKKDAS